MNKINVYKKLAFILMLFANLSYADVCMNNNMVFKTSSFAPTRDEKFPIQITLNNIKKIKSALLEIRSIDNDLIKTLSIKNLEPDKNEYIVIWDGKDKNKNIVPNEVYFPVLTINLHSNQICTVDPRIDSGGEEVYDFKKNISASQVEYNLPVASRMLVRVGIKDGPLLRTIIDWEPRSAGFHAEHWNGQDEDNIIDIENNSKVGYLIMGYKLPSYSIITYGNKKENYRAYHERMKFSIQKKPYRTKKIIRNGEVIRPEFYNSVLKQKSPRINISIVDVKDNKEKTIISNFDEIIVKVGLNPLDEMYLNQDRYEVSFFVDNQFIAEEEQGFVPFTWRWSPKRHGIKPGKHVLTVNISGYSGQVGVKNIFFALDAKP
ncbi:MAG: hypothetical protein FE834_05665 [Gammaproteobacteria bacterium]|nr:hypothetical protein [Gammaproteobacteria bacterium]